MERTILFHHERDTKNKHRYQEDSDEPVMGTIYVSKDLFDDRPDRLELTLRTIGV
jgi:hypothetical protein